MAKVFLNGQPVEHPHEVHEHVSPMSTYNSVIAALFVLTGLTYAVSFASLGSASLAVAMLVALVKASLVVGYFMHLKYDDRYHLFVFLGTILFVGIFFGFTIFDLQSRAALNDEQETFVRTRELDYAGTPFSKVGVDNVPDRRERVLKDIAAHGGGHGESHGGEHTAEHTAEHKAESKH